ncbi:MAG: penicillin-binding protein 1C [Spirochaetia bacterium]|nr:penicillin-binding protein 1C [Spirochaetia bacterium]
MRSWKPNNLWLSVALQCSIACFLFSPVSLYSFPTFQEVKAAYPVTETIYLDRQGQPLQEIRSDSEGRRLRWVALDQISDAFIRAVIRSEDKRFFEHSGADYLALANASFKYLLSDSRRGASTVTMQLVSFLDQDLVPGSDGRSFGQKWKQIRSARELEATWTKGEILEAYLNLVTFRGELTGVESAAFGLLGKAPYGLDDLDSVVLSSLIRSPQASMNDVKRRACMLAHTMRLPYGCSDTNPRVEAALGARNTIRPLANLAPHLPGMLPDRKGEVRTTLDASVQRNAIEILHRHLLSVLEKNVRDGAVLVIDHQRHEVVAYVGSSGHLSAAPLVDSVRSRRQAGSTLKPFVYGLGIERKIITAATLVDDTPLNMQVVSGIYRPENYDRDYLGPIPVRIALAASRNIPAVRMANLLGVESIVETLRKLGFRELQDAEFYGPSIALGSADVTLWELTGAFATLANHGEWTPTAFESVSNQQDNAMHPGANTRKDAAHLAIRVFSPETSHIISSILSDRESRSATFGLENVLSTPFWTAVKTGTSKDMRDNWCVGYSDRYVVGVWVGNASGEPMWNVLGVTGAAPVWLEVMKHLHRNEVSKEPPAPPSLVRSRVEYGDEWFVRGTEPDGALVHEIDTRPGILYPENETIFALDPEIPADRQRVFFRWNGGQGKSLEWNLNGKSLGKTNPWPWKPAIGRHKLKLQLCERPLACKTLQESTFEVR